MDDIMLCIINHFSHERKTYAIVICIILLDIRLYNLQIYEFSRFE